MRKDGTTEVTGSINMNGNTLTRVSNPVNPQDVATKNYAGLLDENGGYHMTGYLNMGFNKIKNLFAPTEPSEAATKKYVDDSDRAFVYGPGGYIATADVSIGGRRITNVGTPLDNQQVANKFYVDTTTELDTAGEKALTRNPDSSFSMNGEIDMGGRSTTGLPNPIDRNAAANKNYVDNGGAIVKNPDGSFKAISDVDLKGFSIKNAAAPVEERDLPTKSYVDKKVSLGSKPIISVNAEEQGSLENGNYEFSFGNGSSGKSHGLGGDCLSAPGRIIRGSLIVIKGNSHLEEEVKINIVVNGIEKIDYSLIKKRE